MLANVQSAQTIHLHLMQKNPGIRPRRNSNTLGTRQPIDRDHDFLSLSSIVGSGKLKLKDERDDQAKLN